MDAALPAPSLRADSLWLLLLAPAIWLSHFLTCYITVALACGRWSPGAGAGAPQTAIAVYTVVAVGAIAWCVRLGLRLRGDGAPLTQLDDDTPASRRHFLAAATLLLALLSLVGALFVAGATMLVPVCA